MEKTRKKQQLYTVFTLVLLTILLSVVFTAAWLYVRFDNYRQAQQLLEVGQQANITLQQLFIEAEQVAGGNENRRRSLQEELTSYAVLLNALDRGGELEVGNQTINLKTAVPQEARPLLLKIKDKWQAYRAYADTLASQPLYLIEKQEAPEELSLDIDLEQAIEIQGGETKRLNPAITRSINYLRAETFVLLALNAKLNQQLQASLNEAQGAFYWSIVGFVAINLLVLLLAALFVRSRLVHPLQSLLRKAKSIERGDISGQATPMDDDNELSEIARAIERMERNILNTSSLIKALGRSHTATQVPYKQKIDMPVLAEAVESVQLRFTEVQEEEEHRAWASQGLSVFVDILREYGNQDIQTLSYALISRLAEYVGAAQGALYVMEEDENRRTGEKNIYAELKACYAYGRQKFIKSRVYPREGVLGQALADGETIYITDVPEGYSEIHSGLGGAEPRSILIVPLKLNELLVGALELASFHEFQPYQIEFIERIATNIASTINNVKANERTRLLLKRQEDVVNALRQQEEMLTQNMEELRATQEEMERNQAALAAQSFAIGSSLLNIEYDLYGSVLNANALACEVLGYSLAELKEKNHRQLVDTETAYSPEYEALWQALREGEAQKGEFKHVGKDGKEVWLQATFVPVPDQRGKVEKVLFLGFDITEEKHKILDYEAQLQAIYRTTAVISFDLQANITDLNELALRPLGYNKSDLLGKHLSWLKNRTVAEDEDTKLLWRKLKGGMAEYGEYCFYDHEGKECWFEGSFNPVLDPNGNTTKVMFFGTDITSRKEAERQMQEAQRRAYIQRENLLALINNTEDRIFSIDKNFFVTIINENARRMFRQIGRDVHEGTNILDTLPHDKYDMLKEPYQKALKGETIRAEESYMGADGREIYLLVSYTPIHDDEDRIVGVTVFAKDITELKRQEEELLQAKRKIEEKEMEVEAILNALDFYIFTFDTRMNLTFFNKAIADEVLKRRNIHIRAGESAIKKIHEFEEADYWQLLYERALKGEIIVTKREVEKEGEKVVQNIRIEPLRNKFGKVYRCVVIIQED
ncbi:PAS domain S-box protein [Thermonema rossianum]|uniref:PAS domain S-box protein n=1 Tax=Thermonema rossianum TaxID=55505 RepID=UPI00056EEA04|nr:PAS domain S-box protein [Thermonema rossianum]